MKISRLHVTAGRNSSGVMKTEAICCLVSSVRVQKRNAGSCIWRTTSCQSTAVPTTSTSMSRMAMYYVRMIRIWSSCSFAYENSCCCSCFWHCSSFSVYSFIGAWDEAVQIWSRVHGISRRHRSYRMITERRGSSYPPSSH